MRHRVAALAAALLVAGAVAPADAAGTRVTVTATCLPGDLAGNLMSPDGYSANGAPDLGVATTLVGPASATLTGLAIGIDDTTLLWSTNVVSYWLGVFYPDGTAADPDPSTQAFSVKLGAKLYVLRGDLTIDDPNLSGETARVTAYWSNRGAIGTSEATCVVP